MRNHKKIFEEVRAAFLDIMVEGKTDKERLEIALNEMDDIEKSYAPDWEAAVMNLIMFVGILTGTLTAERINGVDEADKLLDEMRRVFLVLARHYSEVE